ncbi:FIST signal transduction protein [Rubrivirga marina]|uniref:Histidine kinase n=1 Tax=Rubrivirga marina TaxID=1196024 RepID=A0A271IWY4_9BACT|nr:FIST N-terminal domain-containing protein [Rubrivirga marina]PAP75448.1 hypothetical protein BSZ37_02800 [Rubrivirga marina]
MTVATGHSHDLDSADAIEEVLDQCADALGGRAAHAGLLYAGVDHDHQTLLDGIEARYPGLQLIGCTTHGEISSSGFAEDSVALMLLHSDRVQFRAGVGENTRTNPEAARQAVAQALDGLAEPVKLCIALPEGIGGVDADAPCTIPLGMVDALGAALGPGVPVCGGLAADQMRFEETVQFCNGRVYTDALPVLLAAGPLHVATGLASGWEPLGEAHRLTDVDGLTVRAIDGESPRDVWRRYFGVDAHTGAPNFFAVYPGEEGAAGGEAFYLSSPSRFQDDGSMVTMTPVTPGARLRFTSATRDQLLDGAAASAERARAAYPGAAPEAALVFSCASRPALLGTRVRNEAERLQEEVGGALPAVGFYTYGEICPLPSTPAPVHHVSTFVTVLIGEDE